MAPKRRERWTNHTGNQFIEPLRICEPSSLDELVALVQQAESEGVTIRMVGSGHSWSDVALTTGYLLRPVRLTRLLDDPEALRPQAAATPLVRVEGGIRIRELNAQLALRKLALVQMGGYDGQTVAGVMATATHGSGLEFGPLCDWVRSLDVVGSGGKVWRIEPADGITDPTLYDGPAELVQDDTWFYAALVGMGSLGIVYALTLEVREAFLLKEVRRLSTWEEVEPQLDAALAAKQHYEVYLNPYERKGRHRVIVTTRNETDERPRSGPGGRRNALDRAARRLGADPVADPEGRRPAAGHRAAGARLGARRARRPRVRQRLVQGLQHRPRQRQPRLLVGDRGAAGARGRGGAAHLRARQAPRRARLRLPHGPDRAALRAGRRRR